MKRFRQCRLRRDHLAGTGYQQLVTYLPTHGSNGIEVLAGRHVVLTEDSDIRPWFIEHASPEMVDETYMRRKRNEARDRLATVS